MKNKTEKHRKLKRAKGIINEIILPLKLLIPQPLIRKIPGLTSNEEIRTENVLRHISVDMECLDIGCGNNMLIEKHKIHGGSGIGIDVYPWHGADLIVEDSSNLPFKDGTFDCVTFIACLNHIPARINVLKEASRVLKSNGVIIITNLTPFISKVWHSVIYWDKDQNERGMKNGEVFGFTHNELLSILRKAQLRVIKRERFSWGLNNLYICKKLKDEYAHGAVQERR